MIFMKFSVMCMLVGHAVAAGNSESCTISASISGICIETRFCTDSSPSQEDCTDGNYCCTEAGRPGFGSPCKDFQICLTPLRCNIANVSQRECGSGLVCCRTELPLNVGELCNLSPLSTCSLPEHCSGTSVRTICADDQPCCDFNDLPGVNEQCGAVNPREGVCVTLTDCPDGGVIPGNLCQEGFMCCMIEKVSGQICINANNVSGVCDESCPGCSASQGNCADGLTCCTPDDFGVGDQCEVEGGTCETECINPNDNFGISTCNAPLKCCIPGLNMDCTYMKGRKEMDGVCVLKADCQFEKNKKSKGRGKKHGHKPKQGTCPQDYMRCCPVEC